MSFPPICTNPGHVVWSVDAQVVFFTESLCVFCIHPGANLYSTFSLLVWVTLNSSLSKLSLLFLCLQRAESLGPASHSLSAAAAVSLAVLLLLLLPLSPSCGLDCSLLVRLRRLLIFSLGFFYCSPVSFSYLCCINSICCSLSFVVFFLSACKCFYPKIPSHQRAPKWQDDVWMTINSKEKPTLAKKKRKKKKKMIFLFYLFPPLLTLESEFRLLMMEWCPFPCYS